MYIIIYKTHADFLMLSCFFLYPGSSLQINVSIREGHVVKQFTKIHIVCSSDVVPVGMAADIHINKVSNTIRLLNGQCYYTTKGMKCDPDICGCSKNGLGFSLTYTVQQTAVVYEIACSMILGLLEAYSNTVEIKVIGNYPLNKNHIKL